MARGIRRSGAGTDGGSEKHISRLRKERPETIFVATKAGRKLSPHVAESYTPAAIAKFVEQSLRTLGVAALDLLQLHCPPTPLYYQPELFAGLDALVRAGKLRHYGVSVEKVEEALKAIEYPGWRPCRSSSTCSARGPQSCSSARPGGGGSASSCGYPWRAGCSPAG